LLTVGAASIERRESSGNETKGGFGIRLEPALPTRSRWCDQGPMATVYLEVESPS